MTQTVEIQVKHEAYQMLIGGELVDSLDGVTMDSIDPSNGTVIGQVPMGTARDVDHAVDAALTAYPTWRDAAIHERARLVIRMAETLETHRDELAFLDTVDAGIPIRVAGSDVDAAARALRYYAGLATQVRGETIPSRDLASIDFTLREPWGVVGRLIPFNHPIMFAGARIGAALVAGNTVVLKPSEHTSVSALRLGELLADVLPAGVLNVITGLGSVAGDRLVVHPEVRRISFTGGDEVGRRIQARAAEHSVKYVTLELGGKNPLIVFDDANVERAIDGAVEAMNFAWLGQSCASTSRLFVQRSVYDEVVAGVAAKMDQLVVGDPKEPTTDVGAIAYRQQYDKVLSYLALGIADPAVTLITGGLMDSPPHPDGYYVRPTLFAVASDDCRIAREEIFGPILSALPFDDEEEVVRRANDTRYGLTASIWTADLGRAMRTARRISAGSIRVNSAGVAAQGAPYGGFRDSGVGRESGFEEILDFTQIKNVFVRY